MDFALRLQNFRAVGAAGAVQAAGPTGITLSSTEVDDDHTGLFATLFMEGGTEPGTFSIESGPSWLSIQNVDELHADGTQTEGTDDVTLKVTDADGREFVMASPVTIDVLAAPGDNDSGIGEGDGDIDEGGDFEGEVIQQDTSDGLKISGKSGGTAAFLKDIGPPQAGGIYTMRYSADWSGMNKQGRFAAVGFGFKTNNDFHKVGLRGDGSNPAVMLSSQISGNFSAPNSFTLADDGAASHGTKDGPNWVQIEISEDGETYTFRTSDDGETWVDEYVAAVPTPLAEATDALQFGPAAYFANQDRGVFQLTIEFWQVEGLSAISATNTSEETAATTTHTVALPSGIQSGDLLVLILRHGSTTSSATVAFNTPSGWTLLAGTPITDIRQVMSFYRVADGNEGASVEVTSTDSFKSAHNSYRIPTYHKVPIGHNFSADDPPVISSDYARSLFIAAGSDRSGDLVTITPPANYAGEIEATSDTGIGSNNDAAHLMSAHRELSSLTENPDAFVFSGTPNEPRALTLAVPLEAPADVTFPIVEAARFSSAIAGSASHLVQLPSSIQSGDLLVVVIRHGGNVTGDAYTTPSGWNVITNSGGSRQIWAFYRVADGSEGRSVTFTCQAANAFAAHAYRISNYQGTPEGATAASNDPPNLAPSWGSAKNLWITGTSDRSGTGVSVTPPANYDHKIENASDAGGSNNGSAHLTTVRRRLEAASEDPGTFTTGTNEPRSITIAVQPAA